MQKKYLQAATLLALTMCHGCSEQTAALDKTHEITASRTLASFPLSDRMLLGEFQAQLKPVISVPLTSLTDGEIRFHVTQPGQHLKADTLWAEINPEQLAGEEKELLLNIQNEKLSLRKEIQNTERELERLEYMLNDPILNELLYEDQIPVSSNLVEQLRHKWTLQKEQLAMCGIVEQQKFEQKSQRSRLIMPFDGELLIYLPVSAERTEFRIAAGAPIGIIRDVSGIYLHLVVRDPQIVSIPPKQLSVKFKRDTGSTFSGDFYDSQILQIQNQDALVYRFVFAPEDTAQLISLIGANLTCELWVQSDREFHVVSKIALACMVDGESTFSGWGDTISFIWPAAKMLYSGRTHLGVMSTEEEP